MTDAHDELVLRGWLLLALVFLPYCLEIAGQVPLLTRYLRALPPARRAALPAHPSDARRSVFGSTRFFLALGRSVLRHEPGDGPELVRLKARMRHSACRELLFGLAGWVVLGLLLALGWRPFPSSGG